MLPGSGIWDRAGPAGVTRQASDQGCCGVEVRGFEPYDEGCRERESSDDAFNVTSSSARIREVQPLDSGQAGKFGPAVVRAGGEQ